MALCVPLSATTEFGGSFLTLLHIAIMWNLTSINAGPTIGTYIFQVLIIEDDFWISKLWSCLKYLAIIICASAPVYFTSKWKMLTATSKITKLSDSREFLDKIMTSLILWHNVLLVACLLYKTICTWFSNLESYWLIYFSHTYVYSRFWV
jgi:hypothetical protein